MRKIAVILAAVLLSSCCAKKSLVSEQAHAVHDDSTRMTVIATDVRTDTTHTVTVEQTDEHTVVTEEETITEYDTSAPGNPPSRVTSRKKTTETDCTGTKTKDERSSSSEQHSGVTDITSSSHDSMQMDSQEERQVDTRRRNPVGALAVIAIAVIALIYEYYNERKKEK